MNKEIHGSFSRRLVLSEHRAGFEQHNSTTSKAARKSTAAESTTCDKMQPKGVIPSEHFAGMEFHRL